MSDTVSGAVGALRSSAELLGTAGNALPATDPGATAFGAAGPGRFGDLGRDLYLQWQRAVDARSREAHAHGSRVADLADLAARAAGTFADVEDGVQRGQPGVM